MNYNTLFENKNWLCIQPLDFKTSVAMGGETKWCTAYQEQYFRLLSMNGKIIYCLHKRIIHMSYGLHVKHDGDFELLDILGYRKYPLKNRLPLPIPKPDKIKLPIYILKELLKGS